MFKCLPKNWMLRCVTLVVAAILLTGFGRVPLLREIASFLIVEDRLQPAAAIVALVGHTPFREMEAAKLYHAGLAPKILIIRGARTLASDALQQLGIKKTQDWELGYAVLVQQGVPAPAIIVPKGEGIGTLEELEAAYEGLEAKDAPVILVTSKYHTRRTRLIWEFVTAGRSQPIVRAATGDPFDPERWWHTRAYALSVVREYLGLLNYYAGFPITP